MPTASSHCLESTPEKAPTGTTGTATRIVTGCKVNLYLHVLERLENGYHTLESVFLPLHTPHDVLTVQQLPQQAEGSPFAPHGVQKVAATGAATPPVLTCTAPGIDPHNNTLTKAWHLYAQATGFAPALSLHLEKKVPMGAGLGGGSANAAGLLLHLQHLAKAAGVHPLPHSELNILAAKVGADVPFFLHNVPALATGIGERLSPVVNPVAGLWLLLVCPAVAVNTAWAYNALDTLGKKFYEKKRKCLTYSEVLDISSFADGVKPQNDFEQVVFQEFPELYTIKQELEAAGAIYALMSGSGSSLFGLFHTEEQARKASQSATMSEHITYVQAVKNAGV